MKRQNVQHAYQAAMERYAELDVRTDEALEQLGRISISIHCWQGDDVGGFEHVGQTLGGGLVATGNYPGKARTPEELRSDFEKALSVIPGKHRFNLHSSYTPVNSKNVDRDGLTADHFKDWITWAKSIKIGLDFNQTYFSHPKVVGGLTLTSPDKAIRDFWIEHGMRCREIGAAIGRALGTSCLTNLWIPDGMKDTPADRKAPRERLLESLDAIFKKKIDRTFNVDSVEPKLFGIGAESYTPGSHEFYIGYAVSRQVLLTLDAGHYHPTESIADKISSLLMYLPEIALHVSRGVRWDSDHVVTLTDDLQSIAQEIVWGQFLGRVRIGLDYFDASINRVAAWVIGARNLLKALLIALLAPVNRLKQMELDGDYTARLALMEEAKTLPFGAVWDYHCEKLGVPIAESWLTEIKEHERSVLSKRR
ncbi:MAG TPA: L-rhamnose isomerase [Candidatus Limnocylindrales bacterium]|jgi:L-rhamnose isomerase|nr:L-rhamnose isomerase [Candidatus Limnocylindrales bacterium]